MKLFKTLGSTFVFALAFSALESQAMSKPAAQPVVKSDQAVYQLTQGCYAIQSPATGKFLKKYHQGGIVDNGLSYNFSANNVVEASRFFFKPSALFDYLVTDTDNRFLASHLPAEASAGRYAGWFANWRVDAFPQTNGEVLFSFYGHGLKKTMRHNTNSQGLYFIDLLNPFNKNSESGYKLVAQSGCLPYPEVKLNIVENAPATSDVTEPVRGFIDSHAHITSFEFMGGKFMHGQPYHRWGIADALSDSKGIHGPWGALDIIGNLMGYDDVNHRYDTRGFPEFPSWPNNKQMSHMGYYYKWIERAHKGGLKMMVTNLVENEVLCNVQTRVNPASWINPNSCNTMESIRLQIQRLNELETYVDAQAGGPGKGFFRIVTSTTEARQAIAEGKLAVLMGIEASEIFNCGLKDACSRQKVDQQLEQLYDAGVRSIFPVHRFDNKLGGAIMDNGFLNVGQWLSSGHFFETEECNAHTQGKSMTPGFPLIGDVPVIREILNAAHLQPAYDQSARSCNKHGLTEIGTYLINRLMDKNMLIEVDHMSAKGVETVLAIAEGRNYSGIISSHSWLSRGVNGQPHEHASRIANLGGIITPYNGSTYGIAGGISEYLNVVEQTPYLAGVGFGTDMSGIGNQPGPRHDVDSNPLNYPFETEAGVVIGKQKTGNREFDFNLEGMAHYGMLADHVQDIRENASDRVYQSVMNSAEAYLQMWQRSEDNNSAQHVYPDGQYVNIVDARSGRCIDVPGNDNNSANGTAVQLWDCHASAMDQQWKYNPQTRQLQNRAFPDKCLDNRGQAHNNGEVVIWQCIDHNNLRWDINGSKISNAHNSNIALDAFGTENGARIGQWSYHGQANQQWLLRAAQ